MRLRNSNVISDSDEDGCHSPEPPPDVPKGYLAVYVGSELRRFIIPTSYLTHPLFKVLLEKVEEEFGFDHSGGLTIPCEIETFKYLMKCMESHPEAQPDENNTSGRSLTLEDSFHPDGNSHSFHSDVSHPEFFSADIHPGVSHPEFCPTNVLPYPDVSHPEFFSADIPPRYLTFGILLRRHYTRASHIRNSSPSTFHSDISHSNHT
ncbi:Auxin-induced protein 15A [Vitis vinifera]|uniref:Auxin-induced protein 15A n=1 Tax=Vitis vinifera TaxID=29760 RepID=A0A438GXW8_VITVI|nr:Auxin-induced protein 15A [Vitis vinifera]